MTKLDIKLSITLDQGNLILEALQSFAEETSSIANTRSDEITYKERTIAKVKNARAVELMEALRG